MSQHIVFSYQGAFGPPTYGHYKSMETFIKQITTDYPDKSNYPDKSHYTFLFMPTKSSSSKPHLKGTMYHRQLILQKFCEKLKKNYPDVTIDPSRIEFDKDTSSDTINTIDVLKDTYPDAKIILGMGQDNALQLPYWKSIEEYASKVERIYLVTRQVEGGKIRLFKNQNDDEIGYFDAKVPSWAATTERLEPVFGITDDKLVDTEEGKVLRDDEKIVIGLPEIKEIDVVIPPSSSSMIRHFISRIIKNEEIEENKTKIKNLMFGNEFTGDEKIDKLVEEVIGDYKTLYNVIESLETSYGKQPVYNAEYTIYETNVRQNDRVAVNMPQSGGGKSKRKKSMKKKSKSNRRKSLKNKQRKIKRKGRR